MPSTRATGVAATGVPSAARRIAGAAGAVSDCLIRMVSVIGFLAIIGVLSANTSPSTPGAGTDPAAASATAQAPGVTPRQPR